MMIHQAYGGVSGQTTDILRTANHIQRINHRLYAILTRNTEKSVKQISSDCDRDYFFDAEESIKYRLADSIFLDLQIHEENGYRGLVVRRSVFKREICIV